MDIKELDAMLEVMNRRGVAYVGFGTDGQISSMTFKNVLAESTLHSAGNALERIPEAPHVDVDYQHDDLLDMAMRPPQDITNPVDDGK